MSFDNDADEYKAMLAAIINSSDDAIISKTLDGIITSWNKAAERMFGYSEHEAIGKHISILIPTERQVEEDQIISSIRAGKRVELIKR
jgi:PAS domain S-box-containing protein